MRNSTFQEFSVLAELISSKEYYLQRANKKILLTSLQAELALENEPPLKKSVDALFPLEK